MNIVEFIEEVMDVKLLDFQKKYLTELYDIYEKDPASYDKIIYPCCRGSARYDVIPSFTVMFSAFKDRNYKESEDAG